VRKTLVAAAAALVALTAAPAAEAAVTSAFDGANACTELTGDDAGRWSCSGVVKTWDDQTPIDVNLFLPSDDPPPGGFPLVGVYHGWGGSKLDIDDRWLDRGYAMFSITDRGWGSSCGGQDPKRLSDPAACANGYNHLLDTRYEVRDAQYLMGLLVDDGIADSNRIGAIGGSYGGGMSMALAALKDRVMMPDGSLVPWMSPDGTPISLAGAAPEIPWTDLANSLQPNGATLDYVADAPYRGPNGDRRIGVMKQSFVAGLFATGLASSNYAPPGVDQDADLSTWFGLINAGEPYDQSPLANDIVDEIATHHSSYYIDHSERPAPMLISNGWTDDLFPPDEAIRFYNRTRSEYPGAHIGLFFLDYGHMRGRSADGDVGLLHAAEDAWFDHFVKGTGTAPFEGVTTLPQVCDGADPSGQPVSAPSWAALAPGEVRLDAPDQQTVAPLANTLQSGQAFDPVAGGGDACAKAPADDEQGTANYRLDPAPGGGFTLIGSPTVVADINSPGPTSQLAARLLDVDPASGEETLVDRGLWRPEVSSGADATRQVFQLHPNRWHFAAGHVAKLELMPADAPYGRVSNGQLPVTVQNLELRLPVLEQPGSLGGLVQAPAEKIVPPGYQLAADFRSPATAGGDVSGGSPDTGGQAQGPPRAPKVAAKKCKKKRGPAGHKPKKRCGKRVKPRR
jgi:predicted acyl esterase